MAEVVTLLEKLFEEEKSLKGQRDDTERGGRKAKPSDRAQTARGFDEEEAEQERLGARTWEGGRKGLVDEDETDAKKVSALFSRSRFFMQFHSVLCASLFRSTLAPIRTRTQARASTRRRTSATSPAASRDPDLSRSCPLPQCSCTTLSAVSNPRT
jgi:hypothetical protein